MGYQNIDSNKKNDLNFKNTLKCFYKTALNFICTTIMKNDYFMLNVTPLHHYMYL